MTTTLVTGANGFIGSHLTDALSERTVVAAVRNPSSVSDSLDTVRLDLVDDDPAEAVEWNRIDEIVHLASYTDVRRSTEEPHDCFEVNANGTSRLLAASAESVDQFVYVSSYHVYREDVTGRIDETAPRGTTTPYAASKLAAERQCEAVGEQYDLVTAIVRPFNVFGPGAQLHQVVPSFVNQALSDGHVEPYPGNPTRDFVYVADVCQAIRAVLEDRLEGAFNVGSGDGTTIHEVATAVAETVEREADTTVSTTLRDGDNGVDTKVADIARLNHKTNWGPEIEFDEGLIKTVHSYL